MLFALIEKLIKKSYDEIRMMKKIKRNGFTLIELLVVISIIGILASLALVSYSGAQKQARDTQRKNDLAQYRNALENYAAAHNGMYPSRTGRPDASVRPCQEDGLLPDFISSCPTDPGSFTYYYRSNGTSGGNPDATQYVLWVQLETGGYWEVCSNGKSGRLETAPSVEDGDANGNCQL